MRVITKTKRTIMRVIMTNSTIMRVIISAQQYHHEDDYDQHNSTIHNSAIMR